MRPGGLFIFRLSGSKPAGALNEHREVAGLPRGEAFGPRDPKGSQKLGPARCENRLRFSHPKNKHSPKLAPILRSVSPPHCGYATAPPVPLGTRKMGVSTPKRRRRQFLPDWLSANRQNMPITRAGDGVLRGIVFFARCSLFARLARFILFRRLAERE